jgi:hypothetical protein
MRLPAYYNGMNKEQLLARCKVHLNRSIIVSDRIHPMNLLPNLLLEQAEDHLKDAQECMVLYKELE